MANRRYEESQDDQRNRARYERDGGGREERTTAWRPQAYDQPRARDDGSRDGYSGDRFRAGSRWDQDRGDYERAPGRAHDDYGRQDYGRRDQGRQAEGQAFGFARHHRRYDDEDMIWDDSSRVGRQGEGSFRESTGYPPYASGFPPRSYDPGMYSAFQGQGREEPSAKGFRGHGPKDYKRSDDRIREDVCDRLADADSVDARGISVEVSGGEVTLNGHVSSRQAKRVAEDTVEQCSGIQHVQNNLRIRETGEETGSDSSSASAGESAKSRARSS